MQSRDLQDTNWQFPDGGTWGTFKDVSPPAASDLLASEPRRTRSRQSTKISFAIAPADNFHSKYIISTVENVFDPVRSAELSTNIFSTEEQSSSRRE
jgi:hypothetical protein